MFYLDLNLINIANARDIHFEKFKCFVNRRIGNPRCALPKGQCTICDSSLKALKNLDPRILPFFRNAVNLINILKGSPANMLLVNDLFWRGLFPTYNYQNWKPYFNKKHINSKYVGPYKAQALLVFAIIKDIKRILDYDWFIDKENKHYNAYKLSENLDRNTCTYCNRAYTSTVILKRNGQCLIRPTLDHWYPKADLPLLAVSFQNLIPSCYSCNSSVKGTVQLSLTNHIHPYVDSNQNNDFQFGYFYSTKLSKYRIFVQDAPGKGTKAKDTLKAMFVDEIYNTHHAELEELLIINKNYSKAYIKKMHMLLGQKLTLSEVYRLLFGVYYENKDFHKRPLSKFKYDILKQLGMLPDT